MKHFRIGLFLVFLAVAAMAFGQAADKGTVTQASVALLADPKVRKELAMTKAQESEVQAEFKRMNDAIQQMMKNRPKDATEARAAQGKVRSMQMSLVTRLQSRLTTAQAKRLRELGLQFYGPFSMLSTEIQSELKLNSSQVGKIKGAQKWLGEQASALQKKRQAELKAIPQPADRKDQKAVQAYFQKVQSLMQKYGPGDKKTLAGYKKQAEAKAIAVLSAGQKAQWAAMKGKIFKPA